MTKAIAIHTGMETGPSTTPQTYAAPRWGYLELFIISQTVLPALLYLPGTQSIRVPIRVGAFALSLAALGLWLLHIRRETRPHPSGSWLVAVIGYLLLQVFHPTTNSLIAGAAQAMLYIAVLAPVFWAPDLGRGRRQLWRLLAIMLVCNGINATVGILQVYDPERWLPREFSTVTLTSGVGIIAYEGPDGKQIVRPPGLSDSPGAVCGPAVVAGVLGMIFCVSPGLSAWRRAAALAFALAGAGAIYLSHVRSSLIVLVGSLVAYGIILMLQRERRKATAFLSISFSILAAALVFSVALGGESVLQRFSTLIEEDSRTVYYRSGRGIQVEHAARVLLVEYPLGAGLGRWGMMRLYFGDEDNADSPALGAEVQWPAWILDGGVVLVILYCGALVVSILHDGRAAIGSRQSDVRMLAAIVLAVNIGVLALLFSFVPFSAAIGMQYWFLTGVLRRVVDSGGEPTVVNPNGSARS